MPHSLNRLLSPCNSVYHVYLTPSTDNYVWTFPPVTLAEGKSTLIICWHSLAVCIVPLKVATFLAYIATAIAIASIWLVVL